MTTQEALTSELEMLTQSYNLATDRAANEVRGYAKRKPTDHFGHNLGSLANELSAIAGKIEQTARMLAFIEMHGA